ncbi:CGNR zinc finger domain-containing protein [Nonomuraea soli]|uniref:Zinc finger CGNR domain-containing protein n=1 Tax=Nonomuraea soli TaxID=1032476 RepID=A0A7W0HNA1_9ACTN|nr:CGNR zinc finger domain-containing protein [Nonomuraea soli]MBA2889568.1 hypothetical protein [Nonomuraea soli]
MSESEAPGELEQVRTFLNTWWLPNETRVPEDRLPALAADAGAWRREMPGIPAEAGLEGFRTALREALGDPVALQEWAERHPLRVEFTEGGVVLRPERDGAVGRILAIVADAVGAGRWARLKACPDCGWVFYDHSRNGSRRWCVMNPGGSEARGCGSIAKVRAYRQRIRQAPDSTP